MSNVLTEREFEVATVAGDLLMKGSPEHRIALECVRRKLTREQTRRLMEKLVSIEALETTTASKVNAEYDDAYAACPDPRYEEGMKLKQVIYDQRNVKRFERLMTETERAERR